MSTVIDSFPAFIYGFLPEKILIFTFFKILFEGEGADSQIWRAPHFIIFELPSNIIGSPYILFSTIVIIEILP